ncbi:RING-type domain-containing protein [Favolaschia claudopus]|uniref:RING-type domain-containing protein n=1 Tax=Favolaschia claudopus TaxID=2862362 RepID=A0AAW0CVF1_9AGAR
MPSATRTTRSSTRNNGSTQDVVCLADSDVLAIKRGSKKDSTKQTRKENRPVISSEVIEISSDEDEDEPIAPRASVASKLQTKIRELERVNAAMKRENDELKKKQTLSTDLEEQISCEVCSGTLWAPYILTCGHTFCQHDLENWFSVALKQHRNVYPHYNPNAQQHANVYGFYQQQLQLPLPAYTCPKCRDKVSARPIQNFAVKAVVRAVHAGESSPKKTVDGANIWNRFFPA